MKDARMLNLLVEGLRDAVPAIEWRGSARESDQAIRGMIEKLGGRVCISRRKHFGWLLSHTPAAEPSVLIEMNTGLAGPMRFVMASTGERVRVQATWPWGWPVDALVRCLASDVLCLLGDGETGFVRSAALAGDVQDWLRDLAAVHGRVTDVPTSGPGFEFISKHGASALQIYAWQPRPGLLSLNTLVTNWVADKRANRAVSKIMLMLNRRLRWVRLTRRGTAIEAQATLPTVALNDETWKQARHALNQAVQACREVLRSAQLPAVALAFDQMHGGPRQRGTAPGISAHGASATGLVPQSRDRRSELAKADCNNRQIR